MREDGDVVLNHFHKLDQGLDESGNVVFIFYDMEGRQIFGFSLEPEAWRGLQVDVDAQIKREAN